MPIAAVALSAIADRYVAGMTTIRGRRVHRLLMREFARFELVLPASTEGGDAALLGLAEDGGALAVCRTDGRGAAALVHACGAGDGLVVATSFDLAKDSLPIVGWTLHHAGLSPDLGAIRVPATAMSPKELARATALLRALVAGGSP